jgi:hypothetical protein
MEIQLDDDYGEYIREGGICYVRDSQSQKLPDFTGSPSGTGFSFCEECQDTLEFSTSSDSSSSTAQFSSSSYDDANIANLNGTTQYFSVISNSDLQLPSNMKWSFSGWLKPDNVSDTQHIISKLDGDNKEYNISIDLGGRLRATVVDENDNSIIDMISTSILVAGDLLNFSIVSNGTYAQMYINGTREVHVDFSGVGKQSTSAFHLGSQSGSTPELYYDGALCFVSFWHRALTKNEVLTTFNNGFPYDCGCIGEIFPELSSESSGFMSSSSNSSSSSSFISSSSSTGVLSSESSSSSSSSTEATLITDLVACWNLAGDSLDSVGSNDLTNNNTVPFTVFINRQDCEAFFLFADNDNFLFADDEQFEFV